MYELIYEIGCSSILRVGIFDQFWCLYRVIEFRAPGIILISSGRFPCLTMGPEKAWVLMHVTELVVNL